MRKKFEHVAVEGVGARLGHDVDHAAGMQSVLRRHAVGLHAEFLDGIREGNRQIDVAECVVIVAAVQQVADAVGLAARHRERPDPFDPCMFLLPVRSPPGAVVPAPVSVSNCVRLRPFSGSRRSSLLDHLRDRVLLGLDHVCRSLISTVSVTEPRCIWIF